MEKSLEAVPEYNPADTRILVVDDEPELRAATSRVLIKEGFQVFTAGSRQECFEQLNTRMPDINRWRMRPRITMSYRDFNEESSTTGTRYSIFPAFKVDYAWKKEWIFDFELGVEWVKYTDENFDDELSENVRIGYSYTF